MLIKQQAPIQQPIDIIISKKRIIPHVISIPSVYKHVPIMVYELLPTQPFGKKCNEYLLNRFLIMGLKGAVTECGFTAF